MTFLFVRSEIARTLPSLEALQKVLDQPLSPGAGRLRSQVSKHDLNQEVLFLISNVYHPYEVTVGAVSLCLVNIKTNLMQENKIDFI